MAYNLGPGDGQGAHANRGYDHFDGVMIIVKNGQVLNQYRWSSYTSRDYGPGSQLLSSVRGNARYAYSSYYSSNAFRNYSFKIADFGANYDGVRHAKFYFSTPVLPDEAPPNQNPNGGGKTLIRLHYSQTQNPNDGCNSAGCIVSGNYYRFRTRMVELFQQDYQASHNGNNDPNMERLRQANTHQLSQNLYNGAGVQTVTSAQWNNRLQGSMWLVRPDERPL